MRNVSRPKLPKIDLQLFNGDTIKFTSFWETFEGIVHNNDNNNNEYLSDVDKSNYFKKLLEGPAAQAIQGLPMVEANYESAVVELLKDRYGNQQKIISSCLEPSVKPQACSSDKARQLRMIYDHVNVQVRSLKALEVTSEHYGSRLLPIIMSRIPENLRLCRYAAA